MLAMRDPGAMPVHSASYRDGSKSVGTTFFPIQESDVPDNRQVLARRKSAKPSAVSVADDAGVDWWTAASTPCWPSPEEAAHAPTYAFNEIIPGPARAVPCDGWIDRRVGEPRDECRHRSPSPFQAARDQERADRSGPARARPFRTLAANNPAGTRCQQDLGVSLGRSACPCRFFHGINLKLGLTPKTANSTRRQPECRTLSAAPLSRSRFWSHAATL